MEKKQRVVVAETSKSRKFLPTLLEVKFPCKAFKRLELLEDLRDSTVLEITINNMERHEPPGSDMSYNFLAAEIETFVHLLRTTSGSGSRKLWLQLHPDYDDKECTGQAKAVKAFGHIRGMPNFHVRRSNPITVSQDLSNKKA